jgi:hypothetical protein
MSISEYFMPADSSTSSTGVEALPGLTKIETIDYQWLLSRVDHGDHQQLARLSELRGKHLAALTAATDTITIGDLTVRYADESTRHDKINVGRRSRSTTFKLITFAIALLFLLVCFLILIQARAG